MSATPAMLPTPGVVFRQLNKRMNCCTCAPLTVATIYDAMKRLEADTRLCPYALAEARRKLISLEERRQRREEFHRHRRGHAPHPPHRSLRDIGSPAKTL